LESGIWDFELRTFSNEDPAADRNLRDVVRWATTRAPKPWPRWVENGVQYTPRTPAAGELLITFVNHSTFLIQAPAATVLTDPVWSKRVSPVQWMGPARVHAPGIPFEQLPPIDTVLVSHNHYDHMDLATLRALDACFAPQFVTTLGNNAYLEARGVRRVHELGWWDCVEVGPIAITATPAQHFSARTPFDRNRTLWAGFVCAVAGRRLFFTGDSGYAAHFGAVRARLGPFDAALIPIGAYEPRWFMSAAHMNPDEAVRAHLDLGSPLSVAMHFGCFQLTDEAIDEPVHDLSIARERHGVTASAFRALRPGETIAISNQQLGVERLSDSAIQRLSDW
jgi:L-ascorbate metabolism protein UlaG (beta-lactamase superfamily)